MSYFTAALDLNPVSHWRMDLTDSVSGGDGDLNNLLVGPNAVDTGETAARGLWVSPDLSMLFIARGSQNDIRAFTMSTPGDITTLSAGPTLAVGQDTSGLYMKSDGTELYFTSETGQDVRRYTLSTPWDLNTASFTSLFDVSSQEPTPRGVHLSSAGDKMYIVGPLDNVYQYDLGVAWDITSAVYNSVFYDVDFGSSNSVDLAFNSTGSRLYVYDLNVDALRQFTLNTPWDLSTTVDDMGTVISISSIHAFHVDDTKQVCWFIDDPAGNSFLYDYFFDEPASIPDSGSLANGANINDSIDDVPGLLAQDPDRASRLTGAGFYQIPHNVAYTISTTGELAVMFVMETGADIETFQLLMGKGLQGIDGEQEWRFLIQNGSLFVETVRTNQTALVSNSFALATNTQYHIGVNFLGINESDDIELFTDGVEITNIVRGSTGETAAVSTGDMAIGSDLAGANGLQNVTVDEVTIVGQALTPQQFENFFLRVDNPDLSAEMEHSFKVGYFVDIEHLFQHSSFINMEQVFPSKDQVESEHVVAGRMLTALESEFLAQYDLGFDTVEAEHLFAFRSPIESGAEFSSRHLVPVESEHEVGGRLFAVVEGEWAGVYPIRSIDIVEMEHAFPWFIADESNILISNLAQLLVDDEEIPMVDCDVTLDEGKFSWDASITLSGPGHFGKFKQDKEFVLRIAGEDFNLLVDQRLKTRGGPAQNIFKIKAKSPTVKFDGPRAKNIDYTQEQTMLAKDLVEDIIGTSVQWDALNWFIPAFRFSITNASPIRAAKKVVDAIGAVMEVNPDGTLKVRSKYPVAIWNLETVTPDRTLFEVDHILQMSEDEKYTPLTNKVCLKDSIDGVFSDEIEFVADEENSRKGVMRVYPSPYRTSITLDHTSKDIQINARGVEVREEVETVEFVDGSGTTRFPIDTIVSVTWKFDNLGAVTFDQYSKTVSIVDESKLYSLAEITYTVRSINFDVDSGVDMAQFLVRDVA